MLQFPDPLYGRLELSHAGRQLSLESQDPPLHAATAHAGQFLRQIR